MNTHECKREKGREGHGEQEMGMGRLHKRFCVYFASGYDGKLVSQQLQQPMGGERRIVEKWRKRVKANTIFPPSLVFLPLSRSCLLICTHSLLLILTTLKGHKLLSLLSHCLVLLSSLPLVPHWIIGLCFLTSSAAMALPMTSSSLRKNICTCCVWKMSSSPPFTGMYCKKETQGRERERGRVREINEAEVGSYWQYILSTNTHNTVLYIIHIVFTREMHVCVKIFCVK